MEARGLAKQDCKTSRRKQDEKADEKKKLGDRARGKTTRRTVKGDKKRRKGAWRSRIASRPETVLMVLCGSAEERAASFEQERTSNRAGQAALSRGYIRESRLSYLLELGDWSKVSILVWL